MIFVTVGTHEQQFNRLVAFMDKWAEFHDEEVVIQTGFSTYKPKKARWQKLFSFKEMDELVNGARIVITHGGPSSFIAPLRIGKIPIVIPRQKEYDEHINNHQVRFCKQVAERNGNIYVVNQIEELSDLLENYDARIKDMKADSNNNNEKFCQELEKIVCELFHKD